MRKDYRLCALFGMPEAITTDDFDEVEEIIARCDKDKSGEVGLVEFVNYVAPKVYFHFMLQQ